MAYCVGDELMRVVQISFHHAVEDQTIQWGEMIFTKHVFT